MLYKLNLTSLDSFAELLEKAEITIDYRPYSNFIEILKDRESLIARNQRDILNITSMVNSINKIDESDLLWIKYEDEYVLAKVNGKVSLDQNNAKIKMPCTIYLSQNTPKVIKKIFSDIKFALEEDGYIYNITLKMLDIFENHEEGQACEMEFIKGKGELVEVAEKKSEITPYISDINFIKEHKRKSRKKHKEDPNRGEIIIELNPPEEKRTFSNLPVRTADKRELEDPKDFYIDIMEKQVKFYMGLQKQTMENFMKMEEELWEKFFEMMK